MEKLQYLKQNPRHEEANKLLILRSERLYERFSGETRMVIDRAVMEFERALAKQDRTEIERARKKLAKLLDEIEFDTRR